MSNDKMREAFEKAFPLPSGIFWNEFAKLYDALPGCVSLAEEWQAMLKGYMGALTQQPEHPTADRPTEPRCEDEDPEQWCRVLKWEEDRGDYWEAVAKSQLPEGWKAVPIEPTDEQVNSGWRNQHPISIYRNMLASAPSVAEKREWISCEDQLPTEEDADFNGDVIWWAPALDFPVVRGWSNSAYKDFSPFWMPTGLKRPQPPEKE